MLVAPPVLVVVVLILFPAMAAALSTLRIETPDGAGYSLQRYADFFADRQSLTNLSFTLWVSLTTTCLLLAACLPLAIFLRFSKSPLAGMIQGIAIFPLFVPAIVVCYALIRFVGPNGIVATLLSHVGIAGFSSPYLSQWGPVIGLFWEGIPLTLLILLSALGQVSESAVEAARDVGAGAGSILAFIIVPLVRRSLLVAFALDFLSIFGSFTTPYLLGPASPEMMGVFMQRTFGEVRDPMQAQTQAVVSFLICAVVGLLYVRAISKNAGKQAT